MTVRIVILVCKSRRIKKPELSLIISTTKIARKNFNTPT